MMNRKFSWIVVIIIVSGCATYTGVQLERQYGTPAPRDRVVEAVPPGHVDYWNDVKPVIEQRYPLNETADAMRYVGEGHAQGKVVINVE